MKKIHIIYSLTVLSIVLLSTIVYVKQQKENEGVKDSFQEIKIEQSKFTIIKDDDNALDLLYNGKELEQFMTVVSSKSVVNISINFDDAEIKEEIYLINKSTGDRIYFEMIDGNRAILSMELESDIDYGITINGLLAGAIRAVDDIEGADLDIIQMDMFLNIKCGL